jgi:DNA-binding transcriptional LysR family regulator
MHIKSLKVFCDVVGWRSFSRAADENGISQSGASQVVLQLEQRLGVKLIDRSKRPFVLTPEGEAYYEGCRKLVQRYDALEDQVRTLHEEVSGRVRVVSIYSVGLHHMNRYLQRFLSRYPKANVRLEYQHPNRVYEAVEKDQADLGLVSYPRASRTIEALGWREEPMTLVCAPGHRLAGRGPLALEDLAGENVIGFDSDLTIRREIDRVLQLHGAEVRVIMEFDNIETIKRAIEIDAGVALLPEPTVLREVAAGSLIAVPLLSDELVRPLGIIHRRGKELGITTRRFIELLQNQSDFADGEAAAGPAAGSQIPAGGQTSAGSPPAAAELAHGKNGAEVEATPAAAGNGNINGNINGKGNGHVQRVQSPVERKGDKANGNGHGRRALAGAAAGRAD